MSISQTGQYPQPYVEQEPVVKGQRRFEAPELTLFQKILIGMIVVESILVIFVVTGYLLWLNSR